MTQVAMLLTLVIAREPWVNPETMGPNALPAPYAEPPWTGPDTEVTLGVATQWGRRADHALAPTFRLAAPFGRWVTAYFEGMPLEAWWSSPETQSEWTLPRSQGVAKADIRFGVKLLLFDGSARGAPAVAFRTMTKSTTGKDYDARRFTNAPAYLLDVLIGQRFRPSEAFLITVYASAGYFIWQQGSDGQNDALAGTLALNLAWLGHGSITWETRAYAGWQRGDKVVVQSLRLIADLASWLSIGMTANVGFLAAPRVEGRLDVIVRLPALVPWILE